MPIARLITKVVEDADELAADLRGRGFTVEVVSPNQIPGHRVDLEITVEECASEQALGNAEELSNAEDMDVFIAPGAIIESLRPMIVVPLIPESSEAMAGAEPLAQSLPSEAVCARDLSLLAKDDDVVDEVAPVEPCAAASEVYPEVVSISQLPSSESPVANQSAVHALEAEEVYPPSDWPIWQPLAGDKAGEQAFASVAVEPAPRKTVAAFQARPWQSDRVFWRVAAMVSVGALSVLLLGFSAHRYSPLPRGIEPSGEQRLPFQPTRNEAAIPQDAAAAVPVATPAPAPELKRVVAHVPVVERPSPAEHLAKQVERPKRVRRAATRQADDFIAEDTVVRFGKKAPAPPRVEAQKKSGIKHYSDLQ